MSSDHSYNGEEILSQIAAGDKEAFSVFFYRHHPALLSYAQRFLSLEAARDIISETFIKFWDHRAQFIREAQAYQWLKVAVRNAAYNQLRADQRAAAALGRHLQAHALTAEDEKLFYEVEVETALYAGIVRAIDLLPAQQQKIMKMFFLDEMDNAAIAAALDISVQAVKNQKVTALKSLRKVFTQRELSLCLLAIFTTPSSFF